MSGTVSARRRRWAQAWPRVRVCGHQTVSVFLCLGFWGFLHTGCASTGQGTPWPSSGTFRRDAATEHDGTSQALRDRSLECLKRGLAYADNPVVRSAAVEALAMEEGETARSRIRLLLLDAHPGVRFAACTAVGDRKDQASIGMVRRLLDDPDPSVRAAALYALHRLGHWERSGELVELLLTHPQPLVRCNAAMLLGRIGDTSAVEPLARAMRDKDLRVQDFALEAMAALGVEEARTQLTFMAHSGIGSQEAFAVAALCATKDPSHEKLLKEKLNHAVHLETRLAAARGLGQLGCCDGLDIALKGLFFNRPREGEADDSPEAQRVRIRTMAAMALGDVGDRAALAPLARVLEREEDPRLQVAAAGAILRITNRLQATSPAATAVTRAEP